MLIAEPAEEPFAMLVLSVNYPSRFSTQFVNISLDGLPWHKFTINDRGVATEMIGVRFERFLVTAGWHSSLATVEVDGIQSVVTLDLAGLGSFERQAWLIAAGNSGDKLRVRWWL
jgi:hypothetical protein